MSRSRSRSPCLSRRETPTPLPPGHVHEVTPGQGDLGAQPGALVAHRVLDDLHQDLLPVLERVADAPGALLALRRRHLVDVQEPVLLQAEVDERRVDAVHDVLDLALVDVAQIRLAVWPLDVDLGEAAVLDQRHAQFLTVVGDEDDLALRPLGDHGRRRWPSSIGAMVPRPLPSSCRTMAWGAGGRAAWPLSWSSRARRPAGLGLRRRSRAHGLRRAAASAGSAASRPRPRPPRACRVYGVRRERLAGAASPRSPFRPRPPRGGFGRLLGRRDRLSTALRSQARHDPPGLAPLRPRPPARRRPPRPRAPPLRARSRRSCAAAAAAAAAAATLGCASSPSASRHRRARVRRPGSLGGDRRRAAARHAAASSRPQSGGWRLGGEPPR